MPFRHFHENNKGARLTRILKPKPKQAPRFFVSHDRPYIACVAGVKRGRGRGNLGARGRRERKKGKEEGKGTRRPTRFRALRFLLPLPLLTPATQARPYRASWTKGF